MAPFHAPQQQELMWTIDIMRKIVHLDGDFVEMLVQRRNANNGVPLMSDFGISYKTWQKIRMGEPIRASLAARLVDRMQSGIVAQG